MTVNLIWLKYDTNNSGDLDKQEALAFTREVIATLEPGLEISEYRFNKIFSRLDADNGGTLDK
jgi:hypothetical protein